jgi:hypothetical protein
VPRRAPAIRSPEPSGHQPKHGAKHRRPELRRAEIPDHQGEPVSLEQLEENVYGGTVAEGAAGMVLSPPER